MFWITQHMELSDINIFRDDPGKLMEHDLVDSQLYM